MWENLSQTFQMLIMRPSVEVLATMNSFTFEMKVLIHANLKICVYLRFTSFCIYLRDFGFFKTYILYLDLLIDFQVLLFRLMAAL